MEDIKSETAITQVIDYLPRFDFKFSKLILQENYFNNYNNEPINSLYDLIKESQPTVIPQRVIDNREDENNSKRQDNRNDYVYYEQPQAMAQAEVRYRKKRKSRTKRSIDTNLNSYTDIYSEYSDQDYTELEFSDSMIKSSLDSPSSISSQSPISRESRESNNPLNTPEESFLLYTPKISSQISYDADLTIDRIFENYYNSSMLSQTVREQSLLQSDQKFDEINGNPLNQNGAQISAFNYQTDLYKFYYYPATSLSNFVMAPRGTLEADRYDESIFLYIMSPLIFFVVMCIVFAHIWCSSRCKRSKMEKNENRQPEFNAEIKISYEGNQHQSQNQTVQSSGNSSSGNNTGDRRGDFSMNNEENENLIQNKHKNKNSTEKQTSRTKHSKQNQSSSSNSNNKCNFKTCFTLFFIVQGLFISSITIYFSLSCHQSRASFNKVTNEIYETIADYSNELIDAKTYLKESKSILTQMILINSDTKLLRNWFEQRRQDIENFQIKPLEYEVPVPPGEFLRNFNEYLNSNVDVEKLRSNIMLVYGGCQIVLLVVGFAALSSRRLRVLGGFLIFTAVALVFLSLLQMGNLFMLIKTSDFCNLGIFNMKEFTINRMAFYHNSEFDLNQHSILVYNLNNYFYNCRTENFSSRETKFRSEFLYEEDSPFFGEIEVSSKASLLKLSEEESLIALADRKYMKTNLYDFDKYLEDLKSHKENGTYHKILNFADPQNKPPTLQQVLKLTETLDFAYDSVNRATSYVEYCSDTVDKIDLALDSLCNKEVETWLWMSSCLLLLFIINLVIFFTSWNIWNKFRLDGRSLLVKQSSSSKQSNKQLKRDSKKNNKLHKQNQKTQKVDDEFTYKSSPTNSSPIEPAHIMKQPNIDLPSLYPHNGVNYHKSGSVVNTNVETPPLSQQATHNAQAHQNFDGYKGQFSANAMKDNKWGQNLNAFSNNLGNNAPPSYQALNSNIPKLGDRIGVSQKISSNSKTSSSKTSLSPINKAASSSANPNYPGIKYGQRPDAMPPKTIDLNIASPNLEISKIELNSTIDGDSPSPSGNTSFIRQTDDFRDNPNYERHLQFNQVALN